MAYGKVLWDMASVCVMACDGKGAETSRNKFVNAKHAKDQEAGKFVTKI